MAKKSIQEALSLPVFAEKGNRTPFTNQQHAEGWETVGATPPEATQFNDVFQTIDVKAQWSALQIITAIRAKIPDFQPKDLETTNLKDLFDAWIKSVDLSKLVTLETEQSITGKKTFAEIWGNGGELVPFLPINNGASIQYGGKSIEFVDGVKIKYAENANAHFTPNGGIDINTSKRTKTNFSYDTENKRFGINTQVDGNWGSELYQEWVSGQWYANGGKIATDKDVNFRATWQRAEELQNQINQRATNERADYLESQISIRPDNTTFNAVINSIRQEISGVRTELVNAVNNRIETIRLINVGDVFWENTYESWYKTIGGKDKNAIVTNIRTGNNVTLGAVDTVRFAIVQYSIGGNWYTADLDI